MSVETVIQLLIYGLTDGAVVALNAAGFTLAYAVARQINLAHGSVFALTTVVVANLAAVASGGAVLLARTKIGRLLRAVAEDPQTTLLMGGDMVRAQLIAFGVGGGVAGFGAAIFAAYFGGANAQYGLRSGLAAMTAAVLGGVGDPRGALLAGIVLGIFSSFSDYLLDAQWTPVLVLLLLIGLLAVRPSGLLGTSSTGAGPPAGARAR